MNVSELKTFGALPSALDDLYILPHLTAAERAVKRTLGVKYDPGDENVKVAVFCAAMINLLPSLATIGNPFLTDNGVSVRYYSAAELKAISDIYSRRQSAAIMMVSCSTARSKIRFKLIR